MSRYILVIKIRAEFVYCYRDAAYKYAYKDSCKNICVYCYSTLIDRHFVLSPPIVLVSVALEVLLPSAS